MLDNGIFCIIWVVTLAAQILIVQYGDVVFATAKLDWIQWAVCFAFGISELLWGQVRHLFLC